MYIRDKETFYALYKERAKSPISKEDFDELLRIIEPCINEYQADKMIKEYRPFKTISDEKLCYMEDTPEVVAERKHRGLFLEDGFWKEQIKSCNSTTDNVICRFEYKKASIEVLKEEYTKWVYKWRYEAAGEGLSYNSGAFADAETRIRQIKVAIGEKVLEAENDTY